MDNSDLLVSVIVPFYNGSKTICETLQSIVSQSHKEVEILLVDDGSPEPIDAAIGAYSKHPQIRVIKQKNGGVAAARNTGIKNAKGVFIAFCDQDDIWKPTKLEKQLPHFKNENVGLVYTWTKAINTKGFENIIAPIHQGECFYQLTRKNFITCCTVVARKALIEDIGYFRSDRELQGVDDRYVWMRLSRLAEFAVVKEPLATYVIHGENYSLNNHKMLSADEYCFFAINELTDLTALEKQWCEQGLSQVYLHYANNFLYRNDYKCAAACFKKYWRSNKIRLEYGMMALAFKYIPSGLFIFIKKSRKAILKLIGKTQ